MIPAAIEEFEREMMDATRELASIRGSIQVQDSAVKTLEQQATILWRAAEGDLRNQNEGGARRYLGARRQLLTQIATAQHALAALRSTGETLEANLTILRDRLSYMKQHKDALISQARASRLQGQIMGGLAGTDNNSSWAVFEQAEEKIQLQVANADALSSMAGADDATLVQALTSSSVDEELKALRAAIADG
jgi:phage shock protein A